MKPQPGGRPLVIMMLFFVLYAGSVAAFQAPQVGRIQGTITDLQSGRLLINAAISFRGSAVSIRGFTDGSGRFTLENVPADEYIVTISQDGYVWAKESGPERVTLRPGQDLRDLRFRLLKTSAISGRIIDQNGEPVRAGVSLLSVEYRNGRRGFIPAPASNSFRSSASTNRNGEYRIYGVEPGEYYIRSEIDGFYYYPGVSNPSLALPVAVLPGRDTNADFKVSFVQMHSISVTLSASVTDTSAPVDISSWLITPRDPSALMDFFSFSAMRFTPVGEKRYQSPRLPPGSYELFFSHLGLQLFGHLVFDVKDRDEQLGVLTLTPGISLSGRVRFAEPFTSESMPIQVNLMPANGSSFANAWRSARPEADGTFTFLNVPESNYWVTFTGMPQDAYIQSVRYGSVPRGSADITVAGAADGLLEIVLARGGAMKGTVRNVRGDGIPKAQVVVFPTQDHKQNPMSLKTAEANEGGAFSIQGLAPGEYRALAWEDALPRLAKDPAFLASFGQRGTRFAILPDSNATIDVTVLPQSN